MASRILEIIIDERLEPSRVTQAVARWASSASRPPLNPANAVFKDYVLSCEVFHVENRI